MYIDYLGSFWTWFCPAN